MTDARNTSYQECRNKLACRQYRISRTFNMRRRSYQVWFVLLTGAAVSLAALVADAASGSFDGAGMIVPVVFTGMCACVGVYTFNKERGETDTAAGSQG